jgi:hypothetical protein
MADKEFSSFWCLGINGCAQEFVDFLVSPKSGVFVPSSSMDGSLILLPEMIPIILDLQKSTAIVDFPALLGKTGLSEPQNILSSANFPQLSVCLKESTEHVHPRIHSVWNFILDALVSNTKNGAASQISHIQMFWKSIVDHTLVSSSLEKKYLALGLLEMFLQRFVKIGLSPAALFSQNIVQFLVNSCDNPSRSLYKAAKRIVFFLSAWHIISFRLPCSQN